MAYRAVIAFGANLGDARATLLQAREHLPVVAESSVYRTAPMYVENQPPFLNGVWEIRCALTPRLLIAKLKEIERQMGRENGVVNGPRAIDLDLIWMESIEYRFNSTILVPHARAHERRFVLEPWWEIDPSAVLPGHGMIESLLARVQGQGCERMGMLQDMISV